MLRISVHLLLHAAVPAAVAGKWYRDGWWRAWMVMMAAMAIDLDHLLADPVFDPNRCSIGFHPLHTVPAIVVYCALLGSERTRLLGLGLVIHIVLDGIDCAWMQLCR